MSKKVVHIVGSFYPAIDFGGPIFSTKRICDVLLNEQNLNFEVISFNYKSPKKDTYLNHNDQDFIKSTKKYNITWIDMSTKYKGFISFIKTSIISINKADLIHLTGLFNFYALFTILFCHLFKKKLVISARGSLQALHEFKEVDNKKNKSIYLKFLKWFLNSKRCFWLATTEYEATINTSFIKLPFFIATNPVEIKNFDKSYFNRVNDLAFLSRFSKKKGVNRFINVAKLLKEFNITIAGDGDFELKRNVLEFVNSRTNARYLGVIRGKNKDDFYKSSNILFLPSFSENFGIVIAEALASGCSVITTVNQPWIKYKTPGVLHVLPVNVSDDVIKNEILKIHAMRKNNLKQIIEKSSEIISKNFSIEVAKRQVLSMYNSVLKN